MLFGVESLLQETLRHMSIAPSFVFYATESVLQGTLRNMSEEYVLEETLRNKSPRTALLAKVFKKLARYQTTPSK